MKYAEIIIGVNYHEDNQLEDLIHSITSDTEGYSYNASPKPSLSVWVDNVLHKGEKKK